MVGTWAGGGEVRWLRHDFGYRLYTYYEYSRDLREYPPEWSGQANFLAIRSE